MEKRTPEELVGLAREIRRRVEESLRAKKSGGAAEGRPSAENRPFARPSAEDRPFAEGRPSAEDDFPRAQKHAVRSETQSPFPSAEDGSPRPQTHEADAGEERDSTPAAEFFVDALSTGAETVPAGAGKGTGRAGDENFWDLGVPKPRVYEKPSFPENRVGVTDVNVPDPEPEAGAPAAAGEKIPPRERQTGEGSAGRVVRTVNGPRSVPAGPQGRYQTSRYRRQSPWNSVPSAPAEKRPAPETAVETYTPDGFLIRSVSVRRWESETEFYSRFVTDARRSHQTPSSIPVGEKQKIERVPYFSYVPQYAHMSGAQISFYRWVRESIRAGICPGCDFPYILLYIYEILNLPDEIPPKEGVELLARIWLGYRETYPRLDGCLCEWLPDYCLIHRTPCPASLNGILHEIVPKAQFKEFYLNTARAGLLAKAVIETSSDYDYRTSRYYGEHREDYEKHIPAAVSAALEGDAENRRGIFALDRVYRMTRDSYLGAVAASDVKRRLDIEFVSFTRRADTRLAVTALVKYTENRLRAVLGIKAKLGVNEIGPEAARAVDAYFAPLMPASVPRGKKEDAYMPPDYLKNYESETSGFDGDAARSIEAQSWRNTTRLTGEDYDSAGDEAEPAAGDRTAFGQDEVGGEPIALEGELDSAAWETPAETGEADPGGSGEADPGIAADARTEIAAAGREAPETPKGADEDRPKSGSSSGQTKKEDDTDTLRDALRAALAGRFRAFCRERSLYEGELADRLNTLFLDLIGDVVLEPGELGFALVEDYREDAEEWLK